MKKKSSETERVVIQARMGSTRLPGKVLKKINGKPLLYFLIKQLSYCKSTSNPIISTTVLKQDDGVERFAKQNKLDCFRGSATDVLDRYYQCAKKFNLKTIVRISGDSPLMDCKIIENCLKKFHAESIDYACNIITKKSNKWIEDSNGFPKGYAVEVFKFKVLEKAWKNSTLASDREHVTEYIWRNPNNFKIGIISNDKDFSKFRLVVDYEKDFELIKQIILGFDGNHMKMKGVVEYVKRNKINAKYR